MAEIRHLTKAPVIEAILGFQVDVSRPWDGQDVRAGLVAHFPDYPEIQEQRMLESHLSVVPGKPPESKIQLHPIGTYLLHRPDRTSAVQIRRDGFAFSQLQPYPGWDPFIEAALRQWQAFRGWFGVEEPYSVFVRFINRLSYPAEGFRLSHHFEHPPAPPEQSDWGFKLFREHHVYALKDDSFTIESIFSREPDGNSSRTAEFLLDLTISPSHPYAEMETSLKELLATMRSLKNTGFFSKLTENGLAPYL